MELQQNEVVLSEPTQWLEWQQQARNFADTRKIGNFLPPATALHAPYNVDDDPAAKLVEPT